ncbi:putative cysteine dioxygenase Cdo1 [Aureobasidium sp. EXF-8845]|nr:putative cysteine dioxygenase Cdo1 [Aureobasidium sp. EXF-8845]KAI4852634.1 putative cysteine dioxygenase Cdo1 [Aureobasidium sp. EXF-8846]
MANQPHLHCCATCKSAVSDDPFGQLVREIRQYLGPSSGIDSAHVDPDHIKALMAKYTSNSKHWERYARADKSRGYTRNIVDNVNGKANLILIVWNPGKGSLIHDHADAHCIMKILKGNLTETIYHKPESGDTSVHPLQVKKETVYNPDEITYISDQIGLHRVFNPNPIEPAMSLHLYTPPNAAEFGFHVYDERTSKSSFVPPQY